MLELIHAWAGTGAEGGFRTVRRSPGISDGTAALLVDRSGMDVSDPPAPPIIAYRLLQLDGVPTAVLSRIVQTPGPSPARPGRLAHHVVLRPDERPECGPAALLAGVWLPDRWDDTPTILPAGPPQVPPCELDSAWVDFVSKRVASCPQAWSPQRSSQQCRRACRQTPAGT